MQVGVGDLESCDCEAGARHTERGLLRQADRAGHGHEVGGDVRRGVRPCLVRGARNHEDVARGGRLDGRECDAQVIGPHEASGPYPRDDVVEDSAHATIVTYSCSLR